MNSRLARILIILPALVFGLGHLANASSMAAFVPDYIPAPTIVVYFSGITLILGSLSVIFNKMARLGSLMLAIEILLIAVLIYLPGTISGDQIAFSNFLKDLGLAGAMYYVSMNSDA